MTPAATRAVSIDSSHVALDCVGQGRFRVTISATIARTLLGLLGGLAPALAGAQLAEPLHIRNLNPLVAVFGLPAWDTVPLGTRLGVTAEVANHYRFSVRGDDLLNLDGETFRTNVSLTHGFGGGWSLGVEIPYYRIGGGVLDDVIDGWHSAFGLPDGGRNGRAEGLFLYRYGDSTNPSFLLTEPQSGIGDTQIKFARRFGEDQGFIVQASVKLPTGEEEMLAGSGSGDWSVTLLRSQPLVGRKRPAGYFLGLRSRACRGSAQHRFRRGDLGADGSRRRKLAAMAEVRFEGSARRARRILRYAARGDRRARHSDHARGLAAHR
jgi:hypothetical protein